MKQLQSKYLIYLLIPPQISTIATGTTSKKSTQSVSPSKIIKFENQIEREIFDDFR